MENGYEIVVADEQNLADHPQVICFINPKHPFYSLKIGWLRKRFREGMQIKLLYLEGEKRPAGFIEYVPGEFCWRAVSARGYLFIHCIWIHARKHRHRGIGTILLEDCQADARDQGLLGVASMTSSGAFMADKGLFLKNGFRVVDSTGPVYDLVVKTIRNGSLPHFNDWQRSLKQYQGLHMVYSRQCPWVARFVGEINGTLQKRKIPVTITELTTPAEAQQAPSPYAVFNLIHNGRLLADRYISETRFRNILKKEGL